MIKINFILMLLLVNTTILLAQKKIYTGFFIDDKEIIMSDSYNLTLISDTETIPLRIYENEYFIVPRISNSKIKFVVTYNEYKLVIPFKTESLVNRIDFMVKNYPFTYLERKIIFNKKKKFIYYLKLSPNISKKEIQANSENGILYNELRTKLYKARKIKKTL